jgi:hypothetical protein
MSRRIIQGRQCISLYVLEETVERADALVDKLPVNSLAGMSRAEVWRQALAIGLDELESKYKRKRAG